MWRMHGDGLAEQGMGGRVFPGALKSEPQTACRWGRQEVLLGGMDYQVRAERRQCPGKGG